MESSTIVGWAEVQTLSEWEWKSSRQGGKDKRGVVTDVRLERVEEWFIMMFW